MSFSFRLHIVLGERSLINDERSSIDLLNAASEHVLLRTAQHVPFKETRDVILQGGSWDTETEAMEAGQRWQSAAAIGFAHNQMGIDLRLRETSASISDLALQQARRAAETEVGAAVQVLPDEPGVQVYSSWPPATFLQFKAKGAGSPLTDHLIGSIQAAHQLGVTATAREFLALELYHASFNVDTPDVRLVCLMMAVECLLDQEPRQDAAQAVIREAISKARDLDLAESDKQSLVSSLGRLLNESISAAGRRLADSLTPSGITYLGESPVTFFNRCYTMRSQLVHGDSSDRPSPQQVGQRAARLEIMVGDLLSISALGLQPGRQLDC